MAIRAAFLTAAVFLLLAASGSAAGPGGCLRCHRPHHASSGGCTGCHRGDERSDRLSVAHRDLIRGKYASFALPGSAPVQRGEKLVTTLACRRCHTVGGKGNRLATDLDRLPANTLPEKLAQSIEKPVLFMPDFHCDAAQITSLVNVILAGGLRVGRTVGETPRVVHFQEGTRQAEDVFAKRCGPCHKALTRKRGAVGKGAIGPNLSGLFSAEYPMFLTGKGRWSPSLLEKWLRNPRALRGETPMRPVPLTKEEYGNVLAVLED